ncbi:MAG: hypothetical protein K6A15_01770, partial [Treponema sp.]|nr:hypothetical protein [Treponema sp.]
LTSPLIKDIDNVAYASGSNEMVSGSSVEPFKITLIPPVTDHKGNPVDGTTMYYTLYRGTSTVAAVIQEGFSSTNVELEMVPGTYYVETYATKTNYEQSPVVSATFRIVDNAIFVSQGADDAIADGSRELPFGTLNAAIADVDVRNMPNAHLTIYVDGTVTGNATINCTLTRSVTLTQKTGGSPAVLSGSGSGSTLTIDTTVPVTLKNIKVTGGNTTNGGGIYIKNGSTLTLTNGAVVTGNQASTHGGGIYCEGNLNVNGAATVTENSDGSGGASNVYLPSGNTIKVTGALTNGSSNSQIGVTTEDVPSILTAIPFTTDYGYNAGGFNAGVHPGTYFIGDQYAINKDTTSGEATVFLNSGTFGELLSTLNMTFAISGPLFTTSQPARFTAGTESVITITPTVTAGGTSVNYADIASNVTWNVKLTNGDVDVDGVTSTTNSLTIPASVTAPDTYKILIQTICYGVFTFDDEITITGE